MSRQITQIKTWVKNRDALEVVVERLYDDFKQTDGIPHTIQHLLDMRSIEVCSENLLDSQSILVTFKAMKEGPDVVVDTSSNMDRFEIVAQRTVKEQNRRSNQSYKFTFAFNSELEESDHESITFTILNTEYRLCRFRSIDTAKLIEQSRLDPKANANRLVLQVAIEARGINHAISEIQKTLMPLLGFMNFGFRLNSRSYAFPYVPQVKLPVPSIIAFEQSGKVDSSIEFYGAGQLEAQSSETIGTSDLLKLKKQADQWSPPNIDPLKGSTSELIGTALTLHFDGLIQDDPSFAYLAFFQCLEACLLFDGSDHGLLLKRVKYVVSKSSAFKIPLIGPLLESAFRRRHQLVHRGDGAIDSDDVFFLKEQCDTVILWLMANRETLPTKVHVQSALELAMREDAIPVIHEVANAIIESEITFGRAARVGK